MSVKLTAVTEKMVVDTETPISIFMKLEELNPIYLLESVEGGQQVARYSFIGLDPKLFYEHRDGNGVINYLDESTVEKLSADPLTGIKKILSKYEIDQDVIDILPFNGGLVGYLGYDIINYYEPVKNPSEDNLELPDCLMVFCKTILIYDHALNELKIVVLAEGGERESAKKIIANICELIRNNTVYKAKKADHYQVKLSSNCTPEKFMKKVAKAKEYIKSGDIFQVVLSQRFQVSTREEPFEIYRRLRNLNPSPYLYFLNFDQLQIIGSSPEMLVKVDQGCLETRPIAGTRPRGSTEREDNQLAKGLLNDEKERAEHLMLVDLGRNDLGKVSEIGTVKLKQFMEIERYSHVMHIVSSIKSKLKSDCSGEDAFISCFPAGTVSGAPKIRAMNIIQELEADKRGVYAGAIAYFGLTGNIDSCIAIRTIVLKDEIAYVQAGAGIVADSDPYSEYLETCNKAKGMLKALGVNIIEPRREEMLV